MSMTLDNLELIKLFPSYMKDNLDVLAFCAALEPQFRELNEMSQLVLIYSRLDELDHEALDIIAVDLSVDFYMTSLPIEKKRKLISDSRYIHSIKGTPEAVDMLLSAAFDESFVKEWFEFEPKEPRGTFKVITTDRVSELDKYSEIRVAIDTVKRLTAHLTSFEIQRKSVGGTYIGGVVHKIRTVELREV